MRMLTLRLAMCGASWHFGPARRGVIWGEIESTSYLLCNEFSEKSARSMLYICSPFFNLLVLRM